MEGSITQKAEIIVVVALVKNSDALHTPVYGNRVFLASCLAFHSFFVAFYSSDKAICCLAIFFSFGFSVGMFGHDRHGSWNKRGREGE